MIARPGKKTPTAPSRTIDDFERAYDGIRKTVIKLLYARAASWGHAAVENLADEVMARMWEHWDSIREEPLHWAVRSAHNLVIDERRKRSREAHATDLALDDETVSVLVPPIIQPDERADMIDIWRAMNEMPRKWQQAIIYTRFLGMSAEEAAGVMRCRPSTVWLYVSKARRALERRLQRPRPRSPENETHPSTTHRTDEETT